MGVKTRLQAIATHFGCDVHEMEESRYQSTKTSMPVWTTEDAYYCVTKGSQKPAVHKDGMEWNWVRSKDTLIESFGWKVWQSKFSEN